MALAYCAGYAAVRAAGYAEANAIDGCQDDFAHVDELASSWELDPLDDLKAKALELMAQPVNVNAVARVARELSDRGSLDADLLNALIEVADGSWSEDEFDRYLKIRAAR